MSTRTKFVCADIIISCVLPGFLFGIIVVDEIGAMGRSSLCLQKRNENDNDISLSFSLSSWNLNLPNIAHRLPATSSSKNTHVHTHVLKHECVYVCVCAWGREIEWQREGLFDKLQKLITATVDSVFFIIINHSVNMLYYMLFDKIKRDILHA